MITILVRKFWHNDEEFVNSFLFMTEREFAEADENDGDAGYRSIQEFKPSELVELHKTLTQFLGL